MSRFWFFSALLIFTGLVLTAAAFTMDEINFTDLETECREDRGEQHSVSVTQDNKLKFSGYFPLNSTKADLSYDYTTSDDRIVLNIRSQDEVSPENFRESCYATGIYKAETDSYTGRHTVITKLNGEEIDKQVINFR